MDKRLLKVEFDVDHNKVECAGGHKRLREDLTVAENKISDLSVCLHGARSETGGGLVSDCMAIAKEVKEMKEKWKDRKIRFYDFINWAFQIAILIFLAKIGLGT